METQELIVAKEQVATTGFLDVEIDPTLDLFGEIERLKEEKQSADFNFRQINCYRSKK